MNRMHEANRRLWDETLAGEFQQQSEETGVWRRCVDDPDLAFDCEALSLIEEFVRDLSGKDVCVVGSGDNLASFALAGQGADVKSVDQSQRQLDVASKRARDLGLSITFVRSDATDLSCLEPSQFDLVCSTNGFFVWISDLNGLFAEIQRILKPGGFYVFYDTHPFQRPWRDVQNAAEMEKTYFDTGPFRDSEDGPCKFHWTMGDVLNSLADAGLSVRRLRESLARDSSYWEAGKWYVPGSQPSLLDWKVNPRAGLPSWLLVAAQKISV
jgi:SAM-dependent methyltransferase